MLNLSNLVDALLNNLNNPEGKISDLKKAGFDPNEPIDLPRRGGAGKDWTLLHYIAATAKAEGVKFEQVLNFLCEAFPQIELKPLAKNQVTPLHLAPFVNNIDFMEVFKKDAQKQVSYPHLFKKLEEENTNFFESEDSKGNTPIYYAAAAGKEEAIDFLKENNADKKEKNLDGVSWKEIHEEFLLKENEGVVQNLEEEQIQDNVTTESKKSNVEEHPETNEDEEKNQVFNDDLSTKDWRDQLDDAHCAYYDQMRLNIEQGLESKNLREVEAWKKIAANLLGTAAGAVVPVVGDVATKVLQAGMELNQKHKDNKQIKNLGLERRLYSDLAESIAREMTKKNSVAIEKLEENDGKEKNIFSKARESLEEITLNAKTDAQKLALDHSQKIRKTIGKENEKLAEVLETNKNSDLSKDDRINNIAKCLAEEVQKKLERPPSTVRKIREASNVVLKVGAVLAN